jgi:hypothetical protein
MIKWTTNKEEMEIEAKIADRATEMAYQYNFSYVEKLDIIMDLDACHNNGCPLKLQELLDADDTNFAHDVFGIRSNISRYSGKLENCFLPRYSK